LFTKAKRREEKRREEKRICIIFGTSSSDGSQVVLAVLSG
jgi:hypothetical protein